MDPNLLLRGLSRQAYDAVIFDLDGVITQTARTHALAWKVAFDEFLQAHAANTRTAYRPFDDDDYRRYVDGKPRSDGVRDFLASRAIHLPEGQNGDPPEAATIAGIGNKKNAIFLQLVHDKGVEVYPSSIELIRELRAQGFKTAVVSSSKNTGEILHAVHIESLFDAKVDGRDAARLGLRGKPAPDTFLAAADQLRVPPDRAVVVEDAIAGVEAGHRGHFAVIGVDRAGDARALRAAGADAVVADLSEVALPH
jgi:beta-phosphoglucomutase family hydrolase